MRMLNYATPSANPFHRDHQKTCSRITPNEKTFSKALSRTGKNYIFDTTHTRKWTKKGENPEPQVISNPPKTVYASSKATRSNDSVFSEDTCSVMTFSLASPSSASLTSCDVANANHGANHPDHSVSGRSEDTSVLIHRKGIMPKEPEHSIRQGQSSSSSEVMTKGSFSGMTLQETLNWRRHVAEPQSQGTWKGGNGNKGVYFGGTPSPSSQNSDPALLAIRASAKVKKHLAQAKAKRIFEREETKQDTTPDFMLVRSRLRNAKRKVVKARAKKIIHPKKMISDASVVGSIIATASHETSDSSITGASMHSIKQLILPHVNEDSDVICKENQNQIPNEDCTTGEVLEDEVRQDAIMQHPDSSVYDSNSSNNTSISFACKHEVTRSKLDSLFSQRSTSQQVEVAGNKNQGESDETISHTCRVKSSVQKSSPNQKCNTSLITEEVQGDADEEFERVSDNPATSALGKEVIQEAALMAPSPMRQRPDAKDEVSAADEMTSSISLNNRQKDLRQKLNFMFAQRQHVNNESPCSSTSIDKANTGTGSRHNIESKIIRRDLAILDTASDSFQGHDKVNEEDKDSRKQISGKLNSMLSLRKGKGLPSQSAKAELETSKASPIRVLAISAVSVSECRDDIEVDEVHDSERELPRPLEVTTKKYAKMLSVGIPEAAVRNCMLRDGIDPSVMFASNVDRNKRVPKITEKRRKDEFKRTRFHWDVINQFSEKSVWQQIRVDSDLDELIIDDEEFKSLFQSKTISHPKPSRVKSAVNEGAVKVIDPKRANNGGIILARCRMSYSDIAKGVDVVDDSILMPQQIIGILDYIPSAQETKSLQNYIDEGKDISLLCECEKFMVAIMSVKEAKRKMEVMLFKLRFPSALNELMIDAVTLSKACDELCASIRLRKVLGVILKIGNRLNSAGVESEKTSANGFAVESLAKLNEVKTNRKTTLMYYVASVVQDWNDSLLSVKDELPNVLKAHSITAFDLSLKSLEEELNHMKNTVPSLFNSRDIDDKVDAINVFIHEASVSVFKLRQLSDLFYTKFDDVRSYLVLGNGVKPTTLFSILSCFCNDLATIELQLHVPKKDEKKFCGGRTICRPY